MISSRRRVLLFSAVAAYVVFFVGVHGIGVYAWEAVALYLHPFTPGLTATVLYGSPLAPLVGHLLGLSSSIQIEIFSLLAVVLCIFFIIRHILQNIRESDHVYGLLLLASAPLLSALIAWSGKSDPFLLLAYLAFLGSTSSITRNGSIFFMLLAHKEMALCILVVHVILFSDDRRKLLDFIPGLVLGLLWFQAYSFVLGSQESRIDFVLMQGLSLARDVVLHLPTFLLASFNWFWLPFWYYLWVRKDDRWALGLAVVFVLGVTAITTDMVRVAATLATPIFIYVILNFPYENIRIRSALIGILFALTMLQPGYTGGGNLVFTNWNTLSMVKLREEITPRLLDYVKKGEVFL